MRIMINQIQQSIIQSHHLSIAPGQSVSITFEYSCNYSITSLTTRGMTTTIRVLKRSYETDNDNSN